MTLNTFIQYKFENTGQREKKKKKPQQHTDKPTVAKLQETSHAQL